MTGKKYQIELDGKLIGTTMLEKADAPMGVAFGVIEFVDSKIGYDFIKEYCQKKNVGLVMDYPEDKLISTRTIDSLRIVNERGLEISGVGNQITGMDNEEWEIKIEGIPYPFYEEEFSHHVQAYNDMFKDEK